MHVPTRRVALVVVAAALVVAAATAQPRAAHAAPSPTVTSIVTSGESDRGDVTLTIFGTRLTAITALELAAVSDGGVVPIRVLSTAADRIVVSLPGDLAAGTYRLFVSSKKGTIADRSYVVPPVAAQIRMRSGDVSALRVTAADGTDLLDIEPGVTRVGGILAAESATCRYSIANGYPPSGGKALVGVVESKTTDGAQIRFTRTPETEYFDLGQDGSGRFVIERNDDEVLTLDASGNLAVPVGNAFKPGGGSWATLSDARLKRDVQPLGGALDSLLALRSVSFEYEDPAANGELPGRQTGFVAQEVEKVFPNWVGERADGMKYVAPRGFESLTVAALRELRDERDAQIAKLAAENEALRARLEDQDARIAAIEKALAGAAAQVAAPAAAQDR